MKANNKKRILFIAPLPPPVHGSTMVSSQIQGSRLINDTFDCVFINNSTSRSVSEIGVFCPAKFFRYVSSFGKTLWKLMTNRFDLCYLAITCHGSAFLKDAPFVLLCKLFGRKIVIHQHNKGMSQDVGRQPYKWLLPLVYKDTFVILLSWRLYPDIEKVVPREKVLICHNGIKETEVAAVRRDNSVPVILFLSNLLESKGIIDMLDALQTLHGRGWSFACNIVGSETLEIDAERLDREIRQRDLHDVIRYRGLKTGQEKDEYLKASDVLVFPTTNDCFPLVLLEAMQYGMAIVTTEEGGIADIVSDGREGLICGKRNPADLAARLEQLFEDPEMMARLGTCARNRFQSSFTQDIFESALCDCFNSILEQDTD